MQISTSTPTKTPTSTSTSTPTSTSTWTSAAAAHPSAIATASVATTTTTTTTSIPVAPKIREVWAWNLRSELRALIEAAASCGEGAVLALDTEFPGVAREGPWWSPESRAEQYEALRCNVDLLRPIQLGIAVASAPTRPSSLAAAPPTAWTRLADARAKRGELTFKGVWTFNLRFNVFEDLHTEDAIAFLSRAGVDFPRHATEGVDAALLGRFLATSPLVGPRAPTWLTFSGLYDFGYLLKILGGPSVPLPTDCASFDATLEGYCPRRIELRDWLPFGSLENLAKDHGVRRCGSAHTAGSDALLTLRLFEAAVSAEARAEALGREVSPSAAVAAAAVARRAAATVAAMRRAGGAVDDEEEERRARAAASAAKARAAPRASTSASASAAKALPPKSASSSAWAASARWAMIGASSSSPSAPYPSPSPPPPPSASKSKKSAAPGEAQIGAAKEEFSEAPSAAERPSSGARPGGRSKGASPSWPALASASAAAAPPALQVAAAAA